MRRWFIKVVIDHERSFQFGDLHVPACDLHASARSLQGLDAYGISGGYVAEDTPNDVTNQGGANTGRRYYRVWKHIDLSDEGQQTRFMDMLSTVFKNLALRVTLDRDPEPDTHVASFIDRLRGIRSLFFAPVGLGAAAAAALP